MSEAEVPADLARLASTGSAAAFFSEAFLLPACRKDVCFRILNGIIARHAIEVTSERIEPLTPRERAEAEATCFVKLT